MCDERHASFGIGERQFEEAPSASFVEFGAVDGSAEQSDSGYLTKIGR